MQGNDSERIFNKADEHLQAVDELVAEAAAAGRRLTNEEQAYVAELKGEGSKIMDTAVRASQQERDRSLGSVVTADTSGNLLNQHDVEEAKTPAKPPVSSGRLAD